jgi:hypothetical protein
VHKINVDLTEPKKEMLLKDEAIVQAAIKRMNFDQEILKLTYSFYQQEIDHFRLYIEGFGSLFVSRVKDGVVIGYKDRDKRFSEDDRVTIFFDNEKELKGIHRTVSDDKSEVYMKYAVEYFDSYKGVESLVRDMQLRPDTPSYMKLILMMLYTTFGFFYRLGFRNAKLLDGLQARGIGMKTPCIYVEPKMVARIFLIPYAKILKSLSSMHKRRFGSVPTKGFIEQQVPGSKITKREKK